MGASEILTIATVVTLLTQIVKRTIPGDVSYGVYISGGISLLAVLIWVASGVHWPPDRTDLWSLFSGWATVWGMAAGIHGISTSPTADSDIAEQARQQRVSRVRAAGKRRL
jgi:hypothetical protein